MNKEEAQQILTEELKLFKDTEYRELIHRVGENLAYEKNATSGRSYQIEVTIMWDSKAKQAILVIGSIDDGGLSAFFPITDSFLKFPSE